MKVFTIKLNSNLENNKQVDGADLKRKRGGFASDDDASRSNDASASNDNGIVYFNSGDIAGAKKSFIAALKNQSTINSSKAITPFISCDRLQKEIECALLKVEVECKSRKKQRFQCNERQEYDEGMEVFTEVLQINQSFSMEMQYATLFYNIGQTCKCSKEYKEANNWYTLALKLVEVCEHNEISETSLTVVKIQHNLGNCSYHLGENEEAMKHYQTSLENVRTLGMGEFELAATYNCIAVLYLQSSPSDSKKALEYFKLALSIHQKLGGGRTKEVGTFLNNIGRVLYVQSEFDEALKVYLEALEVRREVLHHDSVDVAATVINAGQAQHKCGNLEQAMGYYKEFVDIMSTRFGTGNRDLVIAYKCMGKLFADSGEMDTARSMFEKVLQAEREFCKKCDPQLASTLNVLGTICFEMSDNDAALKYFREGLEIEKEGLESNRPNIIITLRNIAQIHKDTGNYGEAICVYKEAYVNQIEVHGKSSLEVASTLSSLGLMHFLLNEYWFSLIYYQGALETRRSCYGSDNHKEIASTLNCVGLSFYKLRKYELAKDSFIQCIKIRQCIGLVHRDSADLCYNLATIFKEIGDDDQAIFYYQEALRIEEKIIGEDHSELRGTLQQLGHIHQSQGDYDEAIKYFTRVLNIERKAEGEISIFKLLNIIGNLHLMNGNVDQMMASYIEALRSRNTNEETDPECLSLVITGHNFYAHSKLHPKCAGMA